MAAVCLNLTLGKFSKKEHRENMQESEGTASNAIWAVALVIIVALIVGVVYYSGILKTSPKKEIDINVTAPSR
jgi:hypothetical protein